MRRSVEVLGTGNEDALYAVVNFENGAIGSIDYSWAWPDGLMNGYRVVARNRRHAARPPISTAPTRASTPSRTTATSGGDTHLWPEINGRIVGDLADEIAHFVKATPVRHALSCSTIAKRFDAIPVLDALARVGARPALPVEVVR